MIGLNFQTKKNLIRNREITFFGDSITSHENMYVTNFLNEYNYGVNTHHNWAIGGGYCYAHSHWNILLGRSDCVFSI